MSIHSHYTSTPVFITSSGATPHLYAGDFLLLKSLSLIESIFRQLGVYGRQAPEQAIEGKAFRGQDSKVIPVLPYFLWERGTEQYPCDRGNAGPYSVY